MKRIKTTQDSMLRNSVKVGEDGKQNEQRNSFISSGSNVRRISGPQMRKVPPLRSPLFLQSDTDDADISDNGLRGNARASHISMISPNQNERIVSPLNKPEPIRRKSLSIAGSPAIVLKTPLKNQEMRSIRTQRGMETTGGKMEGHQYRSSLTSLKLTPKGSASRKDKLRQIQHNLFHLLQELDDNQSDTSGHSSPQRKKQVRMVDQEVQTERKQQSVERGEKKVQKKRKSKRSESGVMGVIAGGAVAGAVLGGIFFAVKLFSRGDHK